jgi:hypothetical protein
MRCDNCRWRKTVESLPRPWPKRFGSPASAERRKWPFALGPSFSISLRCAELSCPHDRPRAGLATQPVVGSKRGRKEKSWPAAARKREPGYSVCVDAQLASVAVSWQEELSPAAERSGLFLGHFTGMPMWRRSVAGSLPRRGVGCCAPLLTHLCSHTSTASVFVLLKAAS